MLRLTLICLTLLFSSFALAAGNIRPPSHMISGVKQYSEITGLMCGPGALESVLDYYGPDISQRAMSNVARTSSIGTYVQDIVRTGHFSKLSAAQGRFYPNAIPKAGFAERPLGYAAFGHAQDTPWLEELKNLVAQDIPVIMLMLFSPDPDSGGHYRVLVGYDDTLGEAYFIDPWGRDLKHVTNADGTITWTYRDVVTAWNYPQYGSPLPYFAAAIMPWKVDITIEGAIEVGNQVTVTANTHYPCPRPFNCSSYPAAASSLILDLPPSMRLITRNSDIAIGNLPAGGSATASWRVAIDAQPNGQALAVTGSGTVSGWMPEAHWAGDKVYYPAYVYDDRIGGRAELKF